MLFYPQATAYKLDFEQERSDRVEVIRRFEGEREVFQAHIAKLNRQLRTVHLEHNRTVAQLRTVQLECDDTVAQLRTVQLERDDTVAQLRTVQLERDDAVARLQRLKGLSVLQTSEVRFKPRLRCVCAHAHIHTHTSTITSLQRRSG